MKSRKTNRSKRVDPGCRNHGPCTWCRGNRTHASRRAEPADASEQVTFASLPLDEWCDGCEFCDPGDDLDALMFFLACPEAPRFTFADAIG